MQYISYDKNLYELETDFQDEYNGFLLFLEPLWNL